MNRKLLTESLFLNTFHTHKFPHIHNIQNYSPNLPALKLNVISFSNSPQTHTHTATAISFRSQNFDQLYRYLIFTINHVRALCWISFTPQNLNLALKYSLNNHFFLVNSTNIISIKNINECHVENKILNETTVYKKNIHYQLKKKSFQEILIFFRFSI